MSMYELKSLLRLCITNVQSMVNKAEYKQLICVSTGSRVLPVLTGIIMRYIERKVQAQLENLPIYRYQAYDIFVLLDSKSQIGNLHILMNDLYPTIEYVVDYESMQQLPFLNVLLKRNANRLISVRVFHKSIQSRHY